MIRTPEHAHTLSSDYAASDKTKCPPHRNLLDIIKSQAGMADIPPLELRVDSLVPMMQLRLFVFC